MFNQFQFLEDLATFIAFPTIVKQNREAFDQAYAWIRAFFDPEKTDFQTFEFSGCRSLLIKPCGSLRPNVLGDGHIEVVPGAEQLFTLVREGDHLRGRGVADMKTQCLMMMTVLRDLIAQDNHNDFWILFTEDEEIGSEHGVAKIVEYLAENDLLPNVVFAPDGGPDFAYVEKEKGLVRFTANVLGVAAHASRPFLGENAIEKGFAFYQALQLQFPNPKQESDWQASIALTKISAGEAFNKIPDQCELGFDMRITENDALGAITQKIRAIATQYEAQVTFHAQDEAAYYPKEADIAQAYIGLLRTVARKEPTILHSNGASNGRFYHSKSIHVLMSNPTVIGSHADDECLLLSSLPAYYDLVRGTIQL